MNTPQSGEYLPGQSLYDSPPLSVSSNERREFDGDTQSFGQSNSYIPQCNERSNVQERPSNFMQLVALVQEQQH